MIDRKKVAFSALRTNQVFNGFVKELEDVLAEERDTYENNVASEYRRGRVNVLRELIADITGTTR